MAVSPTGLARAKEGFAHLMAKARERKLTSSEKKMLSHFRQILRRERRPAMNRKSSFRVGDVVYVDRFKVGGILSRSLFWRVFKDPSVIREIVKQRGQINRVRVEFPFGKSYWFDEDVLTTEKPNPKRLTRLRARKNARKPLDWPKSEDKCKACFGTGLTSSGTRHCALCHGTGKTRRNPNPRRSLQKLGNALEVRYRRTIGRQPGYYKHEIKSRRAGLFTISEGWVYVPGRSILITEGRPHV